MRMLIATVVCCGVSATAGCAGTDVQSCDGRPTDAASILACLDRHRDFVPMIDNQNLDTFAMKVTGFRGDAGWAIVFEQAAWWPSASGPTTLRFCHGRCAPEAASPAHPKGRLFTIAPVDEHSSNRLLAAGEWPASIRLRGSVVPTPPRRSLRLSDRPGVETYDAFLLLLDLATVDAVPFFSTDEELTALVPGLPPVTRASRWRHPDLAIGEPPSSSPALQQLAEAVTRATADVWLSDADANFDFERWIFKKNGLAP